jgi:circadian clock protein KaiB
MNSERETGSGDHPRPPGAKWVLRLYIAGTTPPALRALESIREICREHLAGTYTLEVIDLLEQPARAESDQIIAVPTLVRELPPPLRKIIGDLSNSEKVLVGLNIEPHVQSARGAEAPRVSPPGQA